MANLVVIHDAAHPRALNVSGKIVVLPGFRNQDVPGNCFSRDTLAAITF